MPAKTRYLTVFLLQPEIREFEDAVDSTRPLEQHELRDDLPFEGRLYIEPRAPSVPSWLRFVADGVDGDVGDYLNSSTAAVLLFRVQDRILALTFGFGRNLLADGSYELDFGLKVALNTVNADKLRSVELKVVEEMVLNRRVQASRGTSPGTFGLDTGRDILRAVTGEPDDRTLAKRVTGADALAIATKVELDEVGLLGERLIEAYQDTRYQQRFSWIDHVRVVRGREVTDELNARLLQDLRNPAADLLYLAPPELLDWSNLGGFVYTRGNPSEPHLELDLMDYLVNVDVDELDVDDLKRHRVMLQRSTSAESLGPLSEVLDGKPRNGWSPTRTADNDGVPILSLAAVTGFRYRPDQFKRTAVATNPSGHYWLRTGDLLITRSNSPGLVGHAAVYSGEPSPCIYPDLMMRIPVDRSRADPGFVHKWLATPVVRDYIEGRAKGTSPTMKKISQSVVANIPFPSSLPLARQIELSRLVEKVWDQANHVVANTTANVREIEQLDDLLLEESFQPAAPA